MKMEASRNKIIATALSLPMPVRTSSTLAPSHVDRNSSELRSRRSTRTHSAQIDTIIQKRPVMCRAWSSLSANGDLLVTPPPPNTRL